MTTEIATIERDHEWLTAKAERLTTSVEADESAIYDISIWTKHDGAYIAEFLLEGGGPTTVIKVDSRWSRAELHTSDGPVDHESYPMSAFEMNSAQSAYWDNLAESHAEIYA